MELEPPFRPFPGHFVSATPAGDDGQRVTLLGSLAERLAGSSRQEPVALQQVQPEEKWEEPLPEAFLGDDPLFELRISLPDQHPVKMERVWVGEIEVTMPNGTSKTQELFNDTVLGYNKLGEEVVRVTIEEPTFERPADLHVNSI